MSHIWIEGAGLVGRFAPTGDPALPASDRGFAYGDGLFETVRVSRGVPLFLSRHLARLFEGLSRLGFPALPWDEAALAERCRSAIRENGAAEGVLRLTVTRGSGPRGFEPPAEAQPTLVIQVGVLPLTPRPSLPSGGEGENPAAASAILTSWKVDPASPLCYVKHLSALDKVLARRLAREAGVDEALFHNLEGCVTEGAASNLFLVAGGRLLTPAVECGLLPGIARGLLLDSRGDLPLPLGEAELLTGSLWQASEAFLTNAVAGVRALVAVDGRPVGDGRPGPITALVAEHFRRLVERELEL